MSSIWLVLVGFIFAVWYAFRCWPTNKPSDPGTWTDDDNK